MRPRYLTGDMVNVWIPATGSFLAPGMVISVQQSNNVPDAKVRGLQDLQPWSYWVLTSGTNWYSLKIMGPLPQDQVLPCN